MPHINSKTEADKHLSGIISLPFLGQKESVGKKTATRKQQKPTRREKRREERNKGARYAVTEKKRTGADKKNRFALLQKQGTTATKT